MSGNERPTSEVESTCGCKIGTLVDHYSLTDLDDDLVDRWRGVDGDRHSLRDLETFVNRAVLRSAMTDAGLDPLDGEVENVYRLLVDEDSSSGMYVQTRNRLQRGGGEVERVMDDFVSYQTVNRHLKRCRDLEYSADDEEVSRVEKSTQKIRALQNRTVIVTADALEQLEAAGDLAGEFDVLVEINAMCTECGAFHTVDEVLERGGCECQLGE